MNKLGLGQDDWDLYLATLISTHRMKSQITIRDKNEDVISTINEEDVVIVDGAVQIDETQPISRQLSATIVDPVGRFFFDPDAPSANALFIDRFVSVDYLVDVPDLGWVACPVFWGPITFLNEDGWTIAIEAQSKESLLLDPAVMWKTTTYKKGKKITDTIIDILESRGEEKYNIPDLNQKLAKPLSIAPMDSGWTVINNLVKSLGGYHCFYDGSGTFRLRKKPADPIYIFDFKSNVLSRPTMPYDFSTLRNIVQILGPQPEKGKQIVGTARLAAGNQVSPESLSRNGNNRYLVTQTEDQDVNKQSDADNEADNDLDDASLLSINVQFDCYPVPTLENLDKVTLTTDTTTTDFRLKTWTIPLNPTDSMSIGYNKRPGITKRVKI